MKHKSGYCSICDRRVYATGRAPNHILHFVLGFFTGGLWWLFVWLPLCVFTVGNHRCTRCGSKVGGAPRGIGRRAVAGSRNYRTDDDFDFSD